eukprot:gnl/TRDRNA2_/TRDRNA2_196795_c0_seq1.p1 gnl/TRDRNA2_/TRDRNA2_196795_c0~~gnl/TRDRNA2_/TRDRNA2_196795_c0_seq1.p1  ORF type:complete len:266 (+),score=37.83 gnl/TRDRNA2_/TRDRNA2_196795_c0_seq1:86-883(+)
MRTRHICLCKQAVHAMVVHEFNAMREQLFSTAEVDELFAQLLNSPGWRELETRTSRRLVDQYTFEGDRARPPPPHLRFLHGSVQKLLDHLQKHHGRDTEGATEVLPMSCFLCLYEDGEDACPNHVHDCRQLTMSFGSERVMVVEGRRVKMKHGDVIVLDGEQHGVPAQRGVECQPRVSINLFYTTTVDLATREVSVNHRSGGSYQREAGGPPTKKRGKQSEPGRSQGDATQAAASSGYPAAGGPSPAAAAAVTSRGRWRRSPSEK